MNQMMGQISPKHNDKQGSLLIPSKHGESSSQPGNSTDNNVPAVPYIQPFMDPVAEHSDHWQPQLHQIMHNPSSNSNSSSSSSDGLSKTS
jgi:hypothetical protein